MDMSVRMSSKVNAGLDQVDPIWHSIRAEAEEATRNDPVLGAFLYATILNQPSLEEAVMHRIAERLGHPDVSADILRQTFDTMLEANPEWSHVLRVDIQAVYDRDPAYSRFMDPVLYLKGFHAIQTHRLAHWLYKQGRKDFAYYLQSRSSSIFQTDIHPAARLGSGLFLDHATGLVVGETAVVEDNVSILHGVTLGGTGKSSGDRHPKIRQGVLIGAGAKILGNIQVGQCSKIAAGSVVLKSVPHNVTVAGVPARIIGETGCTEPSRVMDQMLGDGI
ncbi:CysE, serine acetyltransferase [Brucella melitensis]|nr:CysE, serine acetyltransferase [Brucella abortus bv. 1 str. 9-941]ADZ66348.1 CysE, serine acetyltransferase [Brucella melitensis M28]AEQ08844.1 serine O-acetyltransferase [Brucella melitensis NI]AEW14990.1 CysE, serine acetyltransferase [Brucella canis HSK A52141]AIB17995.1 Serine acetyltransferase [Brucella suis bv. 2]EEY04818.1 serine acetyltransferase [Brucella neotomae 5K33]EEZ17820.1 serine acetyltransferase [Brucella melitensis bv. 2 str. 63/9]EPZ75233.1 serine O-acetyltransferase [